MKTLRDDVTKHPISNILIVIMMTIGLIAIPTDWLIKLIGETKTVEFLVNIVFRLIIISVMVYLVFLYGYNKVFKLKTTLKALLISIPAFLVAINNFPILPLLTGEVVITANFTEILLFFIYSLTVGAFEEISFRGLVFLMCYENLKEKKMGLFWSVALSSSLFGIVHLVNLLAGSGIVPVLMQIGYSFLIGSMCAIVMIKTGDIFIPILLHGIFNFGGLIVENLGYGNIWTLGAIILTAVVGVIVAIYMIIVLLKSNGNQLDKILDKN